MSPKMTFIPMLIKLFEHEQQNTVTLHDPLSKRIKSNKKWRYNELKDNK